MGSGKEVTEVSRGKRHRGRAGGGRGGVQEECGAAAGEMDFFSFFICDFLFAFCGGFFLVLVVMCSLSLRGDPASRSLLPSFLSSATAAVCGSGGGGGEGEEAGREGGWEACWGALRLPARPPERRRWGLAY